MEKLATGTELVVGAHHVKIIDYIAEGGFAHIYSVEVTSASGVKGDDAATSVACLKRVLVPDKMGLTQLRTEVGVMQKLSHCDYVVKYIDSNASRAPQGPGYEVLVLMELCSNASLLDYMNKRIKTKLTIEEILKIMHDVSRAVLEMHKLKLIHRDIKIENVLIDGEGNFKLADFGSTCTFLRPPRTHEEAQYLHNDILHQTTPQYRCPEMIDLYRALPIDNKSDIWALGVFLYKLCYYTTPFESTGEMAILHAAYQFPSKPEIPQELKNLIIIMLQEQPQMRPNIVQVLYEVLKMMKLSKDGIEDFYGEGEYKFPEITYTVPVVSSNEVQSPEQQRQILDSEISGVKDDFYQSQYNPKSGAVTPDPSSIPLVTSGSTATRASDTGVNDDLDDVDAELENLEDVEKRFPSLDDNDNLLTEPKPEQKIEPKVELDIEPEAKQVVRTLTPEQAQKLQFQNYQQKLYQQQIAYQQQLAYQQQIQYQQQQQQQQQQQYELYMKQQQQQQKQQHLAPQVQSQIPSQLASQVPSQASSQVSSQIPSQVSSQNLTRAPREQELNFVDNLIQSKSSSRSPDNQAFLAQPGINEPATTSPMVMSPSLVSQSSQEPRQPPLPARKQHNPFPQRTQEVSPVRMEKDKNPFAKKVEAALNAVDKNPWSQSKSFESSESEKKDESEEVTRDLESSTKEDSSSLIELEDPEITKRFAQMKIEQESAGTKLTVPTSQYLEPKSENLIDLEDGKPQSRKPSLDLKEEVIDFYDYDDEDTKDEKKRSRLALFQKKERSSRRESSSKREQSSKRTDKEHSKHGSKEQKHDTKEHSSKRGKESSSTKRKSTSIPRKQELEKNT